MDIFLQCNMSKVGIDRAYLYIASNKLIASSLAEPIHYKMPASGV